METGRKQYSFMYVFGLNRQQGIFASNSRCGLTRLAYTFGIPTTSLSGGALNSVSGRLVGGSLWISTERYHKQFLLVASE